MHPLRTTPVIRMKTNPPLLALLCLTIPTLASPQDGTSAGEKPAIHNPYFQETSWKVWRDDESPVKGVVSMVREISASEEMVTLTPGITAPSAVFTVPMIRLLFCAKATVATSRIKINGSTFFII